MTASEDPGRAEQLKRLEPLVGNRPDAMIALARQYAAAGETERAIRLAAEARARVPADGESATLAAELLSDAVPPWHFTLLRDVHRNQAYDAAIRRAVRPGCKVLEIGTGSGILAMMAARAGGRVVTCESNPSVAAAARAVIAANGLSDRIRVVGKRSFELDPTADLGGPADILVSEIVSNDLLSEGVLAAHGDAIARLLKPDARVIPARGRIRVALAEHRDWAGSQLGTVSGFDLSPFNRVARPFRVVRTDSPRFVLRSDPADLFEFDLAVPGPWRDRRTRLSLSATGGTINGILQWIAIDLDGEIYENRPGAGARSCWAALLWPFAEDHVTVCGDGVLVGGYHTEDRVRIWREPG